MNKQNVVASTKELVLIAFLATILFVQEEVLTFFPNVQLTIFLLVLYSKKLGFKRTGLIIAIHVLLDNLVMGSLNFFYTAFMFIGWKLIPLLLNTVFKKLDNCNRSSYFRNFIFFVVLLDIYIIPVVLLTNVNVLIYLSIDLAFELILAASSFVSILWLYPPCGKALDKLLKT